MSAYEEKVKISQFTTVESNAVKFISTFVFNEEADTEHNLRTTFSQLAGPHKFAVLDHQSFGAAIRGISHPRFTAHLAPNWRHELVDFILAYRRFFPGWNNGGFGAANNLGRQAVLVNFHKLDPDKFPDEWVSEGHLSSITRH